MREESFAALHTTKTTTIKKNDLWWKGGVHNSTWSCHGGHGSRKVPSHKIWVLIYLYVTICITLFNFFKRCYWFSAIWSFGYLNLKINPLKLYICWEKSLNFIQSNRCKIVLLLAISYRGYRPSEDFAVEQGKIQLWGNVTSHTVASTLLQWGFVWSCLCISKLSRSFERGTYSLILIYSYMIVLYKTVLSCDSVLLPVFWSSSLALFLSVGKLVHVRSKQGLHRDSYKPLGKGDTQVLGQSKSYKTKQMAKKLTIIVVMSLFYQIKDKIR